jgi:N-acylneuraminate cytidylyltransferase
VLNKKNLVLIPARGGSKGINKKNLSLLSGKPLIQYTIDLSRELFDDIDICVSSDCDEIISFVNSLGLSVPFKRPDYLADDHSSTRSVIIHALDFYESQGIIYDSIILLQPTSPFRNDKHIVDCMKLYRNELDMVVSVKLTSSNPYYVLFEENDFGFLEKSKKGNFTRRQDCPEVWEFNGAVYVINSESIKSKDMTQFDKIIKYEMDERESIDIDTPLDLEIANLMGL